jgi:hypothetical protein
VITANGRRFIKRYLAGQSGTLVGAIGVGIGSTAPTLNDSRMEFEFARIPVAVTDYDFAADQLVFKGTLNEEVDGTIYEVGLWTSEVNSAAGNQESRIITTFDSETEEWDIETFDTANTRIGVDSLKHTPAANATSASVLTGITLDLGDFTSLDTFVVAFYVANASTANCKVRFRTDASNYYEFTINAPTAGYKFASFTKGSASVVGTPNWSDINEVEVRTTAKSAGSASVQYDGIRLEDVDSVAPEYGLIARTVLSVPENKQEGIVRDIEYVLPVNIS